jgi:hypothetical protein
MDHFRLVVRRSWDDTWKAVFNSPIVTVLLAILIFALSTFIHWQRKGFSDVKDVIVIAVEGATATLIVFIVVFLFRCFYLTPKHLIAERDNELGTAIDKVAALEEARKPRIKVSCGKKIEGCVVPDHRGIWCRARLDSTGNNVSGLEASIVGLWEDGLKLNLYGEYMILQSCMSEQLGKTATIREGRPEYINLLFLPGDTLEQKVPFLTLKHYPSSVAEHVSLKPNHEYRIDAVLSCDDTHPSLPFKVEVKFKSNKEIEEFQLG